MEEDLKLELESCPQKEPVISLESSLSSCPVCQIGELKEVKREGKTQMIIYTRDGTKLAEHKEKRCNNKSCRIGAFYGYISHGGDRIYMPDALSQDILVVSSQTGFMIDYLIEIVSDVHLLQVDDLLSLTFFELKLMFLVSGLL